MRALKFGNWVNVPEYYYMTMLPPKANLDNRGSNRHSLHLCAVTSNKLQFRRSNNTPTFQSYAHLTLSSSPCGPSLPSYLSRLPPIFPYLEHPTAPYNRKRGVGLPPIVGPLTGPVEFHAAHTAKDSLGVPTRNFMFRPKSPLGLPLLPPSIEHDKFISM